MKKFLLIGPSGVGKTSCIQQLALEYKTADLDVVIKPNPNYKMETLKLYEVLRQIEADIISVSVIGAFLAFLLQNKNQICRKDNFVFIYLRTSDPQCHEKRLRNITALGEIRQESHILKVLASVEEMDVLLSKLADYTVNIDQLAQPQVIDRIKEIMKYHEAEKSMISFVSREEFDNIAKSIGGPHWANPENRWVYHDLARKWAQELNIQSANKVLEMGTMGVQIVKSSETIDYDTQTHNTDWETGSKPTYFHDARIVPWPFTNKQFDLFIALRVFHHLVPYQKECFLEAKRISKATIIVVPTTKIVAKGIDRDTFLKWNDGVPPTKEHVFPGAAGSAYLWVW